MINALKKTMITIGLVAVALAALVIGWLFFPHRVDLSAADECFYHYRYFDENDDLCNDVVPINDADCATLVDLLGGARYYAFPEAIDASKGFTKDYSLEFRKADRETATLLIKYSGSGTVKISGTTFSYQFADDKAQVLYDLLGRYHRHPKVLNAG